MKLIKLKRAALALSASLCSATTIVCDGPSLGRVLDVVDVVYDDVVYVDDCCYYDSYYYDWWW